jgi:tetratricopeptide (TPR) repeat protein
VARPPARSRIAIAVLTVLVLVHLGAFGLYTARDRQSKLLGLYLDARDQWATGHLDVAAAEYAHFLAERSSVAWPVVLFRNFPDAAAAWFALGRVQAERHQVDAALDAFRHSMALQHDHGRREYRDLLLTSGRAQALRNYAQLRLREEPGSVIAEKDLGAALLALGQPAAAADAYGRALQALPAFLERVDPAHPPGLSSEEADLLNLRSVALRLAGDHGQADTLCRDLGRRAPHGSRLDRLCLAFLRVDAGDPMGGKALLNGYAPPAPEHEALVHRLETGLPP